MTALRAALATIVLIAIVMMGASAFTNLLLGLPELPHP